MSLIVSPLQYLLLFVRLVLCVILYWVFAVVYVDCLLAFACCLCVVVLLWGIA